MNVDCRLNIFVYFKCSSVERKRRKTTCDSTLLFKSRIISNKCFATRFICFCVMLRCALGCCCCCCCATFVWMFTVHIQHTVYHSLCDRTRFLLFGCELFSIPNSCLWHSFSLGKTMRRDVLKNVNVCRAVEFFCSLVVVHFRNKIPFLPKGPPSTEHHTTIFTVVSNSFRAIKAPRRGFAEWKMQTFSFRFGRPWQLCKNQ